MMRQTKIMTGYRRFTCLTLVSMMFMLPLGGCDWGKETQEYIDRACKAIATWHTLSRENCLLMSTDKAKDECLKKLNDDYTKLVAAKTAAILAKESCDEAAFKAALKSLEELLKAATKIVGANVMGRLTSTEAVTMQANAQFVGTGYQLMPGAAVLVSDATDDYFIPLNGSFAVQLQPNGPGFGGPVTALTMSTQLGGYPTIMTLDKEPGTFPSTIQLQPDPVHGGFAGHMHVVLNVQNELLGNPTWVVRFPVHTPSPFSQLNLTTLGTPIPGDELMPTIASSADPDADCNGNGLPDGEEIALGTAADCNGNGVPDQCDIDSEAATDCDGDGVPDACQIAEYGACDSNGNGIMEPACESVDCNGDGIEDCGQLWYLDADFDGVIDECANKGGCLQATIIASVPADGTVDARQPYPPSGAPAQGIDSITVQLDGPASTDPACWTLCESGAGDLEPNGIAAIEDLGGNTRLVTLQMPLAPNTAMTLRYLGDDSGQTITVISHPGNANADPVAAVSDVLFVINMLNNVVAPPFGVYSQDIDQSGSFGPSDVLRTIDLLNGAGSYDPQSLTQVPDAAECAAGSTCEVSCPDGSAGSITCDSGEAAICWCGQGGSTQAMAKCE